MSNIHELCVNWDFTQDTKNKYFNEVITGQGCDLFFSLQDSCRSFFEICTLSETNLYIYEPFNCSSLLLSRSTKPFIYIKNIGNFDLNLKASNSGNLFSYCENKLNENFEFLSGDYLIKPNENLFLTVQVSTDGSRYFSKSNYLFGFYYDINNINEINPSGIHPVCLGSSGLPIYSYELFCNLDDSFNICETNPCEQIFNTTYYASGNFDYIVNSELGRIECHPDTSGKWSLYTYSGGLTVIPNFANSGEIQFWPSISDCKSYSGNMFCIFAESGKCKIITLSGYIKPEKFPDSGNYTSVLSITNNNNENFYTGDFETGYFNNLNLDLLRIDHEGYVQFGTSNCFYVTECEIITGFCFDGNLGLSYDYNSGEFNFGCSAPPYYGGGYFNFKIKPLNESYTSGERQFIFYSNQVCLYLESGKIILDKCDGFKATGVFIETGFYNCIGVYTMFDTFFESINPSEICNFKLNNWGVQGISSSNGLDLCASYKCCYNGVNGLWNLSNTGCSYNFILGMTDSGTNVFLGEIIDFTLIKHNWTTGLRVETKCKNSGDFSTVSGLNSTGLTLFLDYACYDEMCRPEFCFARSQCPLIVDQWNSYCITVENQNFPSNQNFFCACIFGDSIGFASYVWSCTCPASDRIIPYQINKDISGLRLALGNLEICDIYSFQISSTQDKKSEYFCGLLSDIFLCFQFFDGGIYYDDSTTIDFDFKSKNFIGRKHSFNFNSNVDENANLALYISGKNSSIKKQNKICSVYGSNFYEAEIIVNSLSLYDDETLLKEINLNEYENAFFETQIKTGCNLCLYYDLDFNFVKYYSYAYCFNAPDFSSKQLLICNFFGLNKIYEFESGCNLNSNTLHQVQAEEGSSLFVELNLQNGYSLNCVSGFDWKMSGAFLPPVESFPYNYCFEIANKNNSYENSISGNWISTGDEMCIQSYLNFSEIVSIEDSNYTNCCPSVYEIELDFSESRKKTSNIICKTQNSTGEPFVPIFDFLEKIYFYSGIEYRYIPLCSIIFRCNEYPIPDTCINMEIFSCGNSVCFDFPIQALNEDKIKVIAESETIEIINCSHANLNYGTFSLDFINSNSNYICIKVPKICSGIVSPDFCFCADVCSMIQNNINFYIDPYSSFKDDVFYGLNNFLFFIVSQLNSGLVYCCNFSGLNYSESDYNSFMIDLKNEFYDCCYSIPSGSGKFLIDSKISFEELNSCEPLVFKSPNSLGYNFILPIATGINFIDCYIDLSGQTLCSEINVNSGLNYLTTENNYIGGSTGFCYTGSGELTPEMLALFLASGIGLNSGFCTGFLCNSKFTSSQNCYLLSINKEDLNQTATGRSICVSKNYTYSGVQPVLLNSNYPPQDIKGNLVHVNLKNYCSQDFSCSGLFYYAYDIANIKNTSFKIIAPDLTFFTNINWVDDRPGENNICFLCSASEYGQIQKNIASIKYNVSGLVQNNNYLFSYDCSQKINLQIREDL